VTRRAATLDLASLVATVASGRVDSRDEVTTAILDAAGDLLARFGMTRWSMEDVAAAAGIARATLYRRFSNRNELVRATLARDAHRFFTAIAKAVEEVPAIEDKVVEGFLVGLRLADRSLIPGLVASDPATAVSLLSEGALLALARVALVERYESGLGQRLPGPHRAEVELVAEALLRLAVSFVLFPESVVKLSDEAAARQALGRVIRPLLRRNESRG
jgi:AcrR family transcriptional regulator